MSMSSKSSRRRNKLRTKRAQRRVDHCPTPQYEPTNHQRQRPLPLPASVPISPIKPKPLPQIPTSKGLGLLPPPIIEDPGNGPRVKNVKEFLKSSFAHPTSTDNPETSQFASSRVVDALKMMLPEELALITWYNKSRVSGRICPACQRLYRLGDVLSDPISSKQTNEPWSADHVQREQVISGLCSPMCFIVGSYNYPSITSLIWGRTQPEIEEVVREYLNGPGDGHDDQGLGRLVRITRLHDLGLSQLYQHLEKQRHRSAP